MKLFRHYKNKPYKYIGLAKHSETLEEMVIYETRYENAEGRLWVRPKKMFFEMVQIEGEGKEVARFQKIPLKMSATTEVTATEIEIIAPLIEKCFGEWDHQKFYSTFNNHQKFHLLTASIDKRGDQGNQLDQVIGLKLGYERDQWEFYSWMGAVHPDYRGLGVATDLMQAQHDWCRSQGYTKVQTKTENRFRGMLLLNVKSGFEIIGTHASDRGGIKIVMEKKL